MTPKEQKALTQAIQANRRMLFLLDQRLDALAKIDPTLLAEYDAEERLPFFYTAIGSDGEGGLTIPALGENPSFGYVRMHTDSAFVLTRVSISLKQDVDTATNFDRTALGVGFRLYDESSSRWISFTNQNNEPQQKAVFPCEPFSPRPAFSEGGFLFPAECVFPRSAVLRVELYLEDPSFLFGAPTSAWRAYFWFHGYKIFGG